MERIILSLTIIASLITASYAQQLEFVNHDGFYSIGTQSNRTASITMSDIDKDGDIDALVANGRHWPEQNYIFYNNGHGAFKSARPIGDMLEASYSITVNDFNNDGYKDIAVANDKIPNCIYWGSEDGRYLEFTHLPAIAPSRRIHSYDIDQDGDIDILLSNRKAKNHLYLNDGTGKFDTMITYGTDRSQTLETAVYDINNDGHLDLITAKRRGSVLIHINDGKLGFQETRPVGSPNHQSRSVKLADFNNDGYIDIATAYLDTVNIIYYGDANISFEHHISWGVDRQTAAIAVGDIDGDGILDIVEGNSEQPNYVLKGLGNGKYEEICLNPDLAEDTYGIELADINDDGLLDVIESNSDDWNLYYITRKRE